MTAENIDAVLVTEHPDHIVVASGARYRRDGFAGADWEALTRMLKPAVGVTWEREVALERVKVSGDVLVVDEMADVAAPLTAVKLAKLGLRGETPDQMANDRVGNSGGSLSPLDTDLSV